MSDPFEQLGIAAETIEALHGKVPLWQKVVNAGIEMKRLAEENERLTAENSKIRTIAQKAVEFGHNNDCLFCGFKDKALGALYDAASGKQQ